MCIQFTCMHTENFVKICLLLAEFLVIEKGIRFFDILTVRMNCLVCTLHACTYVLCMYLLTSNMVSTYKNLWYCIAHSMFDRFSKWSICRPWRSVQFYRNVIQFLLRQKLFGKIAIFTSHSRIQNNRIWIDLKQTYNNNSYTLDSTHATVYTIRFRRVYVWNETSSVRYDKREAHCKIQYVHVVLIWPQKPTYSTYKVNCWL